MNKKLKIIPLGGLGEIGMNMMVIQYGSDAVIIDCGLMFADDRLPGIDLVLPDFSYVLNSSLKIHAILLTHGHEDHIGSLPFLLRERLFPLYGSRFTLALVKTKLTEHQLLSEVEIHQVKEGDRIKAGPFSVEFIQMSHSIADSLAVAIDTPLGKVIHTGDFKIDPKPVDGRTTDLKRYKKLGEEGVFLLLSDSTNVEVPGDSVSESSVYEGIYKVAHNAPGWVVVASFASHIPRLRQIIELAIALNRKVYVAGRSMIQNLGIARELGLIRFPDDLLVNEKKINSLPRKKVIILSTGTQGEPRSALARMAFNEHSSLSLEPGDRVIMSSRFIPGNERAIYAIINHLYRRGASVFTTKGADVHVSGHGYRNDLKTMLMTVRPKFFVPIHGEYRHLVKHCEVALETGVPKERTLLLEDGDVAEFQKDRGIISKHLELSRSVVDGRELADIASTVLRDRRQLSVTGIVVVVVILDGHSGEVLRGPEVFMKGIISEDGEDELFDDVRDVVDDMLEKVSSEARTDEHGVQEDIRLAVRRFFKSRIDRKPVVIPIVLEV